MRLLPILKLGVALIAYAGYPLVIWTLRLVYPSTQLHGSSLQVHRWLEFILVLVAVGGAAALGGAKLRLRRSGVAGVLAFIFGAVVLKVAPLPLPLAVWVLPASTVAAMMLVATPRPPEAV